MVATVLAPAALFGPSAHAAAGTPVIIDTDMYSDADDAGALATAFAMQQAGEANVLAITVNTRIDRQTIVDNSWKCAAAIAQFYNAGSTPIGKQAAGDPNPANTAPSPFAAQCAAKAAANTPAAGNAVAVLKAALQTQANNSVVIVETGYAKNLADLLATSGGAALVSQKVKTLVVMGGSYPTGNHENNFAGDTESAKIVVDNWPSKVVYSGAEVGDAVQTGGGIPATHPASSPVRAAYEAFAPGNTSINSWDLTAIYHAVRPNDAALTESASGKNTIDTSSDATYSNNAFVVGAGNQTYLTLTNKSGLEASINTLLNMQPTAPTTTSTTSRPTTTSTTTPTTSSTTSTSTTSTSTTSTSTTSTTTRPTTTTTQPVKPTDTTTNNNGYRVVGADGSVLNFGVQGYGDLVGTKLNGKIVSATRTASGRGYWLLGSDGGIFAFGDAKFYGSMGGEKLNKPVVGMAATPTGAGYWLVASDGGIFAFGDAKFYGSMGGLPLNKPVVGMTSSATGNGYRMVASDGGIFAFGDAKFYGSMGGSPLNAPIVGMTASVSGNGYRMVATDGGIFAYGDATFYGSMGGQQLNAPIVGMQVTASGNGYWFVATDGGVFAFGDATFVGSAADANRTAPIVALA